MKKISLWFLILVFTASLVQAQETATQQQLDKLSGQIQDLLDAQAQLGKRMDGIEKEISDLRDKVNTPSVTDAVSHDELKRLADQVQEIDQKRMDDRKVILQQIADLSKIPAVTPTTPRRSTTTPRTEETSAPDVPTKGYKYEVKPGDNLGLIIKAYRDQGVHVRKSQIIAANPNMNPDVLIPGKKIFIPDPNAK